MSGSFTFAVVGHDEAETLPVAAAMAVGAAEAGDRVWFVDSASGDDSAAVARRLGLEVVPAPIGKGRAMQRALDLCETAYVCFLDADYISSEINIPKRLRQVAAAGDHDLLIGRYTEPRQRMISPGLHDPLCRVLFPDLAWGRMSFGLSGFRVVRPSFGIEPLPPGFGAEAHLNVSMALGGGRIGTVEVGGFLGKLRGYSNVPAVARDVAVTLLDLAEKCGRIAADERPAWQDWVDGVLAVLDDHPGEGEDAAEFLSRLQGASCRPMPVLSPKRAVRVPAFPGP